jgi:hypothetical protein
MALPKSFKSFAEFERLMRLPIRSYRDYKTYKPWFERLRPFFYVLYRMELVPKSFYVKYTAKSGVGPLTTPKT